MTKEQIAKLSEILTDVESYLYNDMDTICDEDFLAEVQNLYREVHNGIEILHDSLQ